jgi:NADP-dependent 3-hydroxy acid dehydrogenase YdfG
MKTIVVCGHGPGISDAVARKFGSEGFKVALVARSADKLAAAAKSLGEKGIEAKAFPCDLGNAKAVKGMIGEVRASLGPITVVHYNAYAGGAGDLVTADPSELHTPFDVGVLGLVAAVQAAHADLKAQKDAAVLVTGGGLAFYNPQLDAMAAQWNAAGLAIAKAAQHKTVGILDAKLKGDGIYVGEVVVLGMVKGTAFDSGNATLEPSGIADKFWEIYQAKKELSVNFG